MKSFRMSWLLTILVLIFTFIDLSEATEVKKLPSAVVVGTVYCDTCFQSDFSSASHFISGALVAVQCGGTSLKPSFREEVKTNQHGVFKVHLPFSVSKHVKKIKGCSVKLISSSEPYCAVSSAATSSSLYLKSRKQGTHIFSAGFFTFKPLKQPTLCSQKPSVQNSNKLNSNYGRSYTPAANSVEFPPPIEDPPTPFLPPIDESPIPTMPGLPRLPPLPGLPSLPPLPGLPNFPPADKKTSNTPNGNASQQEIFRPFPQLPPFPTQPPASRIPLPPIPFQPPSFLPPNPFRPPPSILPPNPFQPSPPAFQIPRIPGLTPSPPPPPPLPIPLPPFPFQPSPGFPGISPVSSSPSLKKTSP